MTDQNCVHIHIQNFVILIAAFFSLLSRFSFALLMHPAYAVDIQISKKINESIDAIKTTLPKSSSAMGDYWFDHALYKVVGESRYI